VVGEALSTGGQERPSAAQCTEAGEPHLRHLCSSNSALLKAARCGPWRSGAATSPPYALPPEAPCCMPPAYAVAGDVKSVLALVTTHQRRAQPPLGDFRRTSDATQKAQLHAPGVLGNNALPPGPDLQKGSQASGWPAVAPVQAPPHVRSRVASLSADRSIPTRLCAGRSAAHLRLLSRALSESHQTLGIAGTVRAATLKPLIYCCCECQVAGTSLPSCIARQL